MIRISKKVEYGILAIHYIALNSDRFVSAKEISDELNVSFEFLSKTLQLLMRNGIVKSHKGIKGGYELTQDPEEISVSDIVVAIEGRTSLVECFSANNDTCDRSEECSIQKPLGHLQVKINKVLKSMTIAEMII